MARLRHFPESRFVGTRDDMRVYDCEDPEQFAALQARADEGGLLDRRLLQSFGPDSLAEARNRGFRPVAPPSET